MSNGRRPVAFSDADGVTITFEDDDELFRVDTESRTISGLLVPWDRVARSGFAMWSFEEGSLRWSRAVSRVKLNLHHDRSQIVGYALRLDSTSRGVEGAFKVGSDPDSGSALLKAKEKLLDGFSVEVGFDGKNDWVVDPDDESVRRIRRGRLTGAALTGAPAFDEARVASVTASHDTKENFDGPQGSGEDQHRRRHRRRFRVRFRAVH